jgi:hypothetical protein
VVLHAVQGDVAGCLRGRRLVVRVVQHAVVSQRS